MVICASGTGKDRQENIDMITKSVVVPKDLILDNELLLWAPSDSVSSFLSKDEWT